MKKIILVFTLLLFAGVSWGAESPTVVVSIKPIHSLVAGVMEGVGEPQLLIKTGSPHGYIQRPSEAQALAKADLVVWVGHRLESFLEKPLTTLGRSARQLELSELLESEMLPVREGGSWETHSHVHDGDEHEGHGHDGHEHHAHGHGELDQHIWLSPMLAQRIVAVVAAELSSVDPGNSKVYTVNAARLTERLQQLDAELKTRLAPVRDIPYLVFHAAYQYFEAAYDLNAIGSISVDPERKPGAKRLLELREKIKQLNARCVFSEPQFEPRLVATVIEGTGARAGELDPIGAELKPGAESYFQLLTKLADDLLEGLR